MPTYSNFEVYGPDSREAQQFTPPALLNTMGGGPATWGNHYIDLIIVGDRELPDVYPSNGYYWSRIYFQTSDGNGFNFACENKNYHSGDPEYLESPYTEMTLPCTNYPNDYQTGPRLPYARMGLGYDAHTGDFTSQSLAVEWSTNYYTGLWVPSSNTNGAIVIVYSTEDIYINENSLLSPDEFYAETNQNDTIGITFGVYANNGSNHNVPSEANIVPYYYTDKYNIGLDFTTAEVVIDGVVRRPPTPYSLTPEDMMGILGENGYQVVDQKYELSNINLVGVPTYHLFVQYRNGLGYTQGIQGYDDSAPLIDLEIESLSWSDFDQYKSVNSFTLAQVKQYMIDEDMDVEDLTDNAMYVPYTVKFYDENGQVAKEIVVDFSNLHDTGVDLEGNGGGNTEWENSTDGSKPEDQLDRVGQTPLGNPSLSTLGCFSNIWFMNRNELASINSLLNDPNQYDWDDVKRGLALMGEDPYRAFVDVRMYPFDVAALNAGRTRTGNVAIGGYVSTISSVYLSGNPVGIKRLGGKKIEPYYKNYLDYAPYTEYLLYVPYVGFIELNPTMITNTYLTIDLAVDISTGACCVIVCADGKVVAYRQGTIGVSVPLSSNTSVSVAMKDASSMFGDMAMLLGGIISANPIPAIAGGIGLTKDIGDAIFRPHETRIGGTSCSNPTCNAYLPQSIYLYRIVSEPALPEEDWDAYGKTNGWAVAKKDRVGSYTSDSGIIHAKLTNPGAVAVNNLGTNCPKITQTELDEIEAILASGFYGCN